MQAEVKAIKETTSKTGKEYYTVTLEDGHDYSYWDMSKVQIKEGDEIKCECSPWPNGKGFNIRNVEVITNLEEHKPLPAGFTTTPSPQSEIVKQVMDEALAEGKCTVVHPVKEKYVRGKWELLDYKGLRAELVRARELGADGIVEGQLLNLLRYATINENLQEISEKLTALIDIESKRYNLECATMEEVKHR